jgi:VWFA-related protein
MNMIHSRLAQVLLIAAISSLCLMQSFGQKEPSPDLVYRVSVNLVQVDAVVVDSDDHPVTNLQAEDFRIYQDGKEQKITAFSFIRTQSPQRPKDAEMKPAIGSGKEPPIPLPPVAPLKATRIRRTVVLYVDDLALAFDSINRVRQSLGKWVDTEMQPDDLVAVIRSAVGVTALQQFTSDKRVLHAAIDRVRFNSVGSRVGSSSFAPLSSFGNEPGAVRRGGFFAESGRLSAIASLSTMGRVVAGLNEIPGRKSMIIFSEALHRDREELTVENWTQHLIDVANRATVVIHVIDPRGVAYTGLTAEDDVGHMSPEAMSRVDASRYTALVASQDGMVWITKETGGLFIHNTNDILTGLKTAVDDGNGYYLIGYQPSASTVEEMTKGRPKLHDIRVRVKKPGLHVRSRSRFISVPSQDETIKPNTRRKWIEQALGSPFTDETVPVRLTPLFFQSQEGKPAINALLHFDASKLTFSTIEDGWREASIDLAAATFDADGRQVDIAYKRGTVQARGRTYENMLKSGVAYLMHFPVENPGAYIMRVVMYDNKSRQMGSATQFVDIPDLSKKELALSGIVLAAEALKPQAFNQQEGVMAYENSNGTAAVRIFESVETIAWGCQILNAQMDSSGKPQLKVQVRLFHEDREINPEKPLDAAIEIQDNSSRAKATGQLQLQQLMPGHYAIQVIVFDMLAKEDRQMAVQSMDFEIRASTTAQIN